MSNYCFSYKLSEVLLEKTCHALLKKPLPHCLKDLATRLMLYLLRLKSVTYSDEGVILHKLIMVAV